MVYNKHLKHYVIPAEGEDYCQLCKGRGTVKTDRMKLPYNIKHHKLVCHKCLGTGVLDWVEKATGKNLLPEMIYCQAR